MSRKILDEDVPLSQSRLWALQKGWYERAGLEGWASGVIPHFATCNAFIAEAYARVVFGWLRDVVAGGIDPSQPVYIVELGAGSGRFAFLFLQRLQALLARSPFPTLSFVYVMTDFSEPVMASWQVHPSLQGFIQAGILDFARFDLEKDQSLKLRVSGLELAHGGLKNPLAVVANYYLDSIPQDVFWVDQGQLYACLATVTLPEDGDSNDPSVLEHAELLYEDRLVEGDYYGDPELDQILASYRETMPKGSIRFPIAAIAVARLFDGLAAGRWMLLSADKGFVRLDRMVGLPRPGLALHGSFSMTVNYHALGAFFEGRGGELLQPEHPPQSLNVVCCVAGSGTRLDVRAAYAAAIATFGPDDYFSLRKGVEPREDLSLEQAMALARLGRGDATQLQRLTPMLRRHVPEADLEVREDLIALVDQAWAQYFHIGEQEDFPFTAGTLYLCCGAFERAITMFETSLRLYGPDEATLQNLEVARTCLQTAAS